MENYKKEYKYLEPEDRIHIPLTIERHLENYAKCRGNDERYETLWTTWAHNKKWLTRMLQLVCQSFQSYSMHDASHSEAVLHNIELILGENRVAELSATDAFILLHICYLHDIGMVLTNAEKKEIVTNQAFFDMVDELGGSDDEAFQKAVRSLKQEEYRYPEMGEEDAKRSLYRDKLEVCYAMINLLANYQRGQHGEKSLEMIKDGIVKNTAFGSGLTMSEIPKRIFIMIAECAGMHTASEISAFMELPYRDGGYVYDYMHPRFNAVMLELGDALDMDNNRFHPLMAETAGQIPHISEIHERKHAAIRRLCINSEIIEIEADCESQDELRLIRSEYDMILSILETASYYWAEICPKNLSGCLPALKEPHLLLEGKLIPKELVTARFNISQKKAFYLLEGSNVYQDRYVFLRELLQNAIDATKIQYFIDSMMSRVERKHKDSSRYSIREMNDLNSMENYSIDIEFEIKARRLLSDELKDLEEGFLPENYEAGVLIKVKDSGIGIGKEDICGLAAVGENHRNEINLKMPKWLQVTGEFGIGLQSVFVMIPRFYCYTYLRNGECYRIEFNSGVHGGYINTTPLEEHKDRYGGLHFYGTEFQMFLPLDNKISSRDCIECWKGEDPFSVEYMQKRLRNQIVELISQMILYLDGQIGEAFFPINVRTTAELQKELLVGKSGCNRLNRIKLNGNKEEQFSFISHICKASAKGNTEELSGVNEDERVIVLNAPEGADFWALDCRKMKLYIWCDDAGAIARLGVRRFLGKISNLAKRGRVREDYVKGARIYYKGIFLETREFSDDAEILEYIDIKQRLPRRYLNISRNCLTDAGEKYLEEEIYRKILSSAKKALKVIGNEKPYKEKLERYTKEVLEEEISEWKKSEPNKDGSAEKIQEYIVSVSWLSYFAFVEPMKMNRRSLCADEKQNCGWQHSIEMIEKMVKDEKFTLLKMPCLGIPVEEWWNRGKVNVPFSNIAEIVNKKKKYAVLSYREPGLRSWRQYLLHVDEENILKPLSGAESIKIFADEEKKLDQKFLELLSRAKFRRLGEQNGGSVYVANYLIAWLMRNIPTQAILMDESGDTRLNILGYEIPREIYVNRNAKTLIWKRALEIYEDRGIERFATFPFLDLKYLAVKNLPEGVYKVSRGYMSAMFKNSMLFPLTGGELVEMKKRIGDIATTLDRITDAYRWLNKREEGENGENGKLIAEELFRKVSSLEDRGECERLFDGGKRVWDHVWDEKEDALLKHEKIKDLKHKLFDKENELASEAAQDDLLGVWMVCMFLKCHSVARSYEKERDKFIQEVWDDSQNRLRLLDYIYKERVYDVEKDEIDECCRCLLGQIYDQNFDELLKKSRAQIVATDENILLYEKLRKLVQIKQGKPEEIKNL